MRGNKKEERGEPKVSLEVPRITKFGIAMISADGCIEWRFFQPIPYPVNPVLVVRISATG